MQLHTYLQHFSYILYIRMESFEVVNRYFLIKFSKSSTEFHQKIQLKNKLIEKLIYISIFDH